MSAPLRVWVDWTEWGNSSRIIITRLADDQHPRVGDPVVLHGDPFPDVPAVVVGCEHQDVTLVVPQRLPRLAHDDSFAPHPMGYPAWSRDPENVGLEHPLTLGTLIRTSDLADPAGAAWVGRITSCEDDQWGGWVYRVLPLTPEER